VVTYDLSVNWDISCSGLVFSSVEDLFFISVGGLVIYDWNVSGLNGDNRSVFRVVFSVVPGVLLSSVLSLVLDPVVGVEDGVVSGLLISSVEDSVLVGVPGLWFISVLGLRVGSGKDRNLSPVSVLFFLSVENLVVSLIGGEGNISIVGLSIVSVLKSWLPGESLVVIWSILDFIGRGVPDFLIWSILGFDLRELSGDWNLSSSDLRLCLCLDGVLDLIVLDLNVTEQSLFTIFGMSMGIVVIAELDSGNGTDEGNCKASHRERI